MNDNLKQSARGWRSVSHELEIQRIPRQRLALVFRAPSGVPSYLTGPWSDSFAQTKERARQLIRTGSVARRNHEA